MNPHAIRSALSSREMGPLAFRAALASVPAAERDAWVDGVFGLEELPNDSRELPRGCVPYLPCPVNTLLRMVEVAAVQPSDVFVDIGSGVGRATALIHFMTGADAIGVEVQSELAQRSRELAWRLNAPGVATLEGDAAEVVRHVASGSVFFLYCPFGMARASQVLDDIEPIARARAVRVCSVSLPLPARPWLELLSSVDELAVYQSRAGQAPASTQYAQSSSRWPSGDVK